MDIEAAAPAGVIADDRLREGYSYWRHKAAGAPMPRRAHIDPTEIPKLLPFVRLVDVIGPGKFRYRLVGDEARHHHTVNPTGRYIDEVLSPPSGPRIIALYEECVRERRPLYVEHEYILPNGGELCRLSKVLYLPLSESGSTVHQVLCLHVIAGPSSMARLGIDLWAQPYRELAHVRL